MTSLPPLALSDSAAVLCITCILLVPFAAAGISLINVGLGRSRSAGHQMLSSLLVISVAAFAYFFCGFAWQGFAGGPAHVLTMGGKPWDWLGAAPFFLRGLESRGIPSALVVWLGILTAGLAALIPVGSGTDRWRLSAACASSAILAGFTYPIFAHWVWGGGWLSQLGANYGLGHGFLDVGGAATIQSVGGLTALSIAWILGPRRGKYTSEGMPMALPGHNAVFILFGCVLALIGWTGLNSAGAILFAGVNADSIPLIAINTLLSAGAAGAAAALTTRIRFGKPDASLTANGWIGGLVASSAGCAFIVPAEAVVIGFIAGLLVTLSVEWIELQLSVDDPGGAISAHAVGGIWGIFAAGLFARIPSGTLEAIGGPARGFGSGDAGQMVAQLVGIATLLGFVLPLTYGLNWLLDRLYPQRVAPEGERQGMDLYELGAGAYPEFITHSEDSMER
jgi:ammonium transporter, Amt family